MPYVQPESRDRAWGFNDTPGELNHQVTLLAIDYLKLHGLNYQSINDVIGALEGAKLEFYRRVVVPFEDGKIQTNGDVYPHVQVRGGKL